MKIIITLTILFLGAQLFSQTNYQKFKSQDFPIKKWIIFHPLKAKKAEILSKKALKISDSIAATNLFSNDKFGGRVDAFRHAFWMATLRQQIGKCAAQSLGKAYERSNKRTFKRSNRKGTTSFYDKPSKKMDLFNNKVGLSLVKRNQIINKNELIIIIVQAIKNGKLKILKKDSFGNFLNCKGQRLNLIDVKGWRNDKCLVSSNK